MKKAKKKSIKKIIEEIRNDPEAVKQAKSLLKDIK